MGVTLSGLDLGMAKQALDFVKTATSIDKERGKTVSCVVTSKVF
jgi:hypothetical protein